MSIDPELLKQIVSEAVKAAQSEVKKEPEIDQWALAEAPLEEELDLSKPEYEEMILQPSDISEKKELTGFKTHTFLDLLFIDENSNCLNGIPNGSQTGIVGVAGSGKSILIEEIAVQVANEGKKVLLVSSEDIFISNTSRFDLQSRLMQKAKILGLNWDTIKENLYVLDAISNPRLREWDFFAEIYRYAYETREFELALIDSITMLESYRGALKYRLMELSRYNQVRGVTAIYVNQRASEDFDKLSIAGGIGLAHGLDANIIIDLGRTYFSDQTAHLGKRGTIVNMCRVTDCRLCSFIREHIPLTITNQGFLRLTDKGVEMIKNFYSQQTE